MTTRSSYSLPEEIADSMGDVVPYKEDIPDPHEMDLVKAAQATCHLRAAQPKSWREKFRPIVAELVEMIRVCGMTDADADREFRAAWRWGARANWPYKVWRDEIALQMGRISGRIPSKKPTGWMRQRWAEQAGQVRLFE